MCTNAIFWKKCVYVFLYLKQISLNNWLTKTNSIIMTFLKWLSMISMRMCNRKDFLLLYRKPKARLLYCIMLIFAQYTVKYIICGYPDPFYNLFLFTHTLLSAQTCFFKSQITRLHWASVLPTSDSTGRLATTCGFIEPQSVRTGLDVWSEIEAVHVLAAVMWVGE